jgi:hypothetical protein
MFAARFRARPAAGPVLLLLVLAAGLVRPLAAQLPPLTAPKKYFRFDISGAFGGYQTRFLDGARESAAQDFVRSAVGQDFFPALATADALLAKVTGLPTAALNLGSTSASQVVLVGTGGIGLAYGLTSRLTLFGNIPFRQVKIRSSFSQDSATANAGFNPADPNFGDGAGGAQDALFFSQFDAAMAALAKNLSDGLYNGNPSQKALAEATLAAGTSLRGDLFSLLLDPATASPFLPTRSTPEGTALLGKVTTLQGVLQTGLGVTGFTQAPALPDRRLDDTGMGAFISNPNGPVAGSMSTPTINAMGDVEVGAAYLILDGLADPMKRSGVRVAVQGLARLRTSQLDDPNLFMDVGTGERQPDAQASVVTDLLTGRFGGRLTAGYNLQLAGDALKRISLPSQPIAYASTLAAVTRDPGDEISLGATPFYRLSRTFALVAGAMWTQRGSDKVELFPGQDSIPGAPPALLAADSKRSWTTLTAGVSYSAPLETREGKTHRPLDAGISWHGVVAASGGRVPRSSDFRLWLRMYGRIW